MNQPWIYMYSPSLSPLPPPSPPDPSGSSQCTRAHLTSDSRMSASRWEIKPLWLFGSLRSFLYSSAVYSCHLFLISSVSVRSITFLSFIEPIFAWNVPLVSLIFLKTSLVFPILLSSSISLHWSLRKAFSSLLAILWSSAFRWNIFPLLLFLSLLSFSQLFVRPCQTTILPFCILFLGMVSVTASCTMSQIFVHSSSGTLSDLIF